MRRTSQANRTVGDPNTYYIRMPTPEIDEAEDKSRSFFNINMALVGLALLILSLSASYIFFFELDSLASQIFPHDVPVVETTAKGSHFHATAPKTHSAHFGEPVATSKIPPAHLKEVFLDADYRASLRLLLARHWVKFVLVSVVFIILIAAGIGLALYAERQYEENIMTTVEEDILDVAEPEPEQEPENPTNGRSWKSTIILFACLYTVSLFGLIAIIMLGKRKGWTDFLVDSKFRRIVALIIGFITLQFIFTGICIALYYLHRSLKTFCLRFPRQSPGRVLVLGTMCIVHAIFVVISALMSPFAVVMHVLGDKKVFDNYRLAWVDYWYTYRKLYDEFSYSY